MKSVSIILILGALLQTASAGLKINEVFYNVAPQGGNQYVEIYNPGPTNEYLDGKILTDEAGIGVEGVFQWPGTPGGTTLPVLPGAFVRIAVDATNATASADWECYAGPTDTDNPSVPNLVLVVGANDLGLNPAGDGIILADGTSTNLPIPAATIIDGMNYGGGDGELALLSSIATEGNANITTPTNSSLSRCTDGYDSNISSASDFFARFKTYGASNNCAIPFASINDLTISEGATSAVFTITMSTNSAAIMSLTWRTSNGTAIAGADYSNIPPTVITFGIGVQTQAVAVRIIDDALVESNETFTVILSDPINCGITKAIGTCTITDNDVAVPPLIVFTSQITRVAGRIGALSNTWTSTSGGLFQVQSTTNLLFPAWTNISGIITSTGPTETTVDTNTSAAPSIFYRVLNLH